MNALKLQQNDGARRGHKKVYVTDSEKILFHKKLFEKSILKAQRLKGVKL